MEGHGVLIYAGNRQLGAVKALQIPGIHVDNPKYFKPQPVPAERNVPQYDGRDIRWREGHVNKQNVPYARVLVMRGSARQAMLDEVAKAYEEVLGLEVEWIDAESAAGKPVGEMDKPELLAYAVSKNLKVDGRMGEAKILAAIQGAEAA